MQKQEASKSERRHHETKLEQLGFNAAPGRCLAHANSKRACLAQRPPCAYQPAGLIAPAVCYDPVIQTPGYVYGVRPLPSASGDSDDAKSTAAVFADASGLLRRRLRSLDPFPGRAGYDRLKAMTSQQEPAPLTAVERRAIDAMRVQAQSVFDELQQANAFDTPDVRVTTKDGVQIDLTPGDQIFRRGAFGVRALEHHGVYIGRGLVIEVGGGGLPAVSGVDATLCALDLKSSPARGVVGLSPLDEFNQRNAELVKIEYRPRDRLPRDETVRHAIALLGRWNYKLQRSNCEHFATYVTTGKWDSRQMQRARDAAQFFIIKPLRSTWTWLAAGWLGAAPAARRPAACRLQWNAAPCLEEKKKARGASVRTACAGQPSTCYSARTLAAELQRQRRDKQPAHDPETGVLLTPMQVRLIETVAARTV